MYTYCLYIKIYKRYRYTEREAECCGGVCALPRKKRSFEGAPHDLSRGSAVKRYTDLDIDIT